MTVEQAGMLLDVLHAAFPRTTVPAETVQIYARYMTDLDFEQAATAVATYIAEGKYFPTIAEIRARVDHGNRPPEPDQAFAEVMRTVAAVGYYRIPRWSHPAIAEAVDSITWREVCLSENAPALRAHFTKAYEAASRRALAGANTAFIKQLIADLPKRALEAREQRKLKP